MPNIFQNVDTRNRRLINRTGADRARADINDIVWILLEVGTNTDTVFVAANLANMPPITLTHVDLLKLLQEIDEMRTSMKILTEGQSELAAMMLQKHENRKSDSFDGGNTDNYITGPRSTVCEPKELHSPSTEPATEQLEK